MNTLIKHRPDYNIIILDYLEDRYRSPYSIVSNNDDYYIVDDVESSTLVIIVSEKIAKPQCFRFNDTLFIGYDCCFYVIRRGNIVSKNDQFGPFYEITASDAIKNSILALFEIGVLCFSSDGQLKWQFDAHDLIYNYGICGSCLIIETQDNKYIIDMRSGTMEEHC